MMPISPLAPAQRANLSALIAVRMVGNHSSSTRQCSNVLNIKFAAICNGV